MSAKLSRLWVVVPAGGSGSRFASQTPKQYQSLNGTAVIERTLQRLLAVDEQLQVVVAVAEDDDYWPTLTVADNPRVHRADAGKERADSVLAGLQALRVLADPDDWVLVHDAARPCVLVEDIRRLIDVAGQHEVGGILATPVTDTIKRGEAVTGDALALIEETSDRSVLFQAQTPQMFRLQSLHDCLHKALGDAPEQVTDEASAMEYCGFKPLLVQGSRSNIKITYAEDLAIAGAILAQQE
jgi:2-C-methyl-D-erythritol 4-phosphate cytidylyltransferase